MNEPARTRLPLPARDTGAHLWAPPSPVLTEHALLVHWVDERGAVVRLISSQQGEGGGPRPQASAD